MRERGCERVIEVEREIVTEGESERAQAVVRCGPKLWCPIALVSQAFQMLRTPRDPVAADAT